jgi:rhamnosyltransferase
MVTYHPDRARLADTIVRLKACVAGVVIVDNGSDQATQEWLTTQGDSSVEVLLNGSNLGVGAAQNAAIRLAVSRGAELVLLLDQDSFPDRTMIANLSGRYEYLQRRGVRVGAVAPCYVDKVNGHEGTYLRVHRFSIESVRCETGRRRDELEPVDVTIASGLMIPTMVLNQVGLMDESLFVDHVDTDWCLRARARGYQLFVDCTSAMAHNLGDGARSFWLGRQRYLPVYAPVRHYYQWRNSIVVSRRPYVPASWLLVTMFGLTARFAARMLVGPGRREVVRMTLLGLLDGLRGKVGPCPYRPRG